MLAQQYVASSHVYNPDVGRLRRSKQILRVPAVQTYVRCPHLTSPPSSLLQLSLLTLMIRFRTVKTNRFLVAAIVSAYPSLRESDARFFPCSEEFCHDADLARLELSLFRGVLCGYQYVPFVCCFHPTVPGSSSLLPSAQPKENNSNQPSLTFFYR